LTSTFASEIHLDESHSEFVLSQATALGALQGESYFKLEVGLDKEAGCRIAKARAAYNPNVVDRNAIGKKYCFAD